jgi:hypothetical protein
MMNLLSEELPTNATVDPPFIEKILYSSSHEFKAYLLIL